MGLRNSKLLLLLIGVLALQAACSTQVHHRVRSGDTLYRLSKTYDVSIEAILAANQLSRSTQLKVGQKLLIPGADQEIAIQQRTPGESAMAAPDGDRRALALAWPIAGGVVTSGFGERKGSHHDGIDVSAPAGRAVLAAQDGDIIFSDVLRGYGNLVIIRHRSGYSTVYAHNQVNLVREGQNVRRGDIIARVGTTGHASGSNLHFEVRKDNVARNPMSFLPVTEQLARQDIGDDR